MVSDGLGGVPGGDVASEAVVEFLPPEIRRAIPADADLSDKSIQHRVQAAVESFSRTLYEETNGQPAVSGSGATVVVVVIRDRRALVVHLGDSRAYLCRDSELSRLTQDHTLVQSLVNERLIPSEEAALHPARAQLVQFVGMAGTPHAHLSELDLQEGDCLLLCSDGLTNQLTDTEIVAILKAESHSTAACRRLVDAANNAGGRDNTTVLVVYVT